MKEVNEPLIASFEEVRTAFLASVKGNRHRDFATMVSGISHGGGQKVRCQPMLAATKTHEALIFFFFVLSHLLSPTYPSLSYTFHFPKHLKIFLVYLEDALEPEGLGSGSQ